MPANIKGGKNVLRITKIFPGNSGQMSVPGCTILGMETKWFKYTYVCTGECDALIEYTMKAGYTPNETELTCLCGSATTLLSVADATIAPTNEREQMETTTMPDTYNPNLLVTYKSIINGDVSYPTIKVVDLEYHLDSYRRLQDQLAISNGQIGKILDNLDTNGWYNPNVEKEDVLRDLCEILGHEPKQTVMITGSISFEVSYEIPMEDVEDFDARYFLQDNLTLDSYHGDVCIESYEVEDADVRW